MEKTLPIGVFKTQCYQLCQDVAEKDLQLIVTRHGKPLIRVMPFATSSQGTLNVLKGTATWVSPVEQIINAEIGGRE